MRDVELSRSGVFFDVEDGGVIPIGGRCEDLSDSVTVDFPVHKVVVMHAGDGERPTCGMNTEILDLSLTISRLQCLLFHWGGGDSSQARSTYDFCPNRTWWPAEALSWSHSFHRIPV